jgi:hypothetical protein
MRDEMSMDKIKEGILHEDMSINLNVFRSSTIRLNTHEPFGTKEAITA